MGRDRISMIARRVQDAYEFVRSRIDGLTDDEFFWEPVPGCWSVRRNEGVDPPEFMRSTPNRRPWYIEDSWNGAEFADLDPPPLTTIAWLLVHLGSCKVMYHQDAFAAGPLTFDDLVPGSAADAIELLDRGQRLIVAALDGLTDDGGLDEKRSLAETNSGEEWPVERVFWTLHSHDLTHGAEIARMRALHRHGARFT